MIKYKQEENNTEAQTEPSEVLESQEVNANDENEGDLGIDIGDEIGTQDVGPGQQ